MYNPRVAASENTMLLNIELEKRSVALIEPFASSISFIPLNAK